MAYGAIDLHTKESEIRIIDENFNGRFVEGHQDTEEHSGYPQD